jgi:2-oxoglutarate/2-oxoacid ferredoxin oxidoreductase subunit beta
MSSTTGTVNPIARPGDYKSDLKPVWCAGCGDFGVLNAMAQAFATLGLRPERTLVVSGIGCSSRIPGYLKTFGFNSVHGRALPIAIGAKLGNTGLTILAAGGDGDGFSIGTGHFPHACRRNVDITYVMMDNNIYGLTKGQLSPTSPSEMVTATSGYGSVETPINPVGVALGCEATFVARGFSGDIKHLADIIIQGIRHPGFAFIQVLSPCVTFVGKDQFQIIKNQLRYLDQDPNYDASDLCNAFKVVNEKGRISVGVIHRSDRPSYHDKMAQLHKAVETDPHKTLASLMDLYRV